ncbi:hypothetical protein PISMIDRAFT_11055 [Pisolithus microcarpus 441]|uniref:Unplaced genomic scaffold scaffold_44, whole genome shotgun sequence n=1 Tax=Pisolithus microcarpus 441 TaxID=765257 RepID=A0A0C9Z2M3_9AGAM|nr:hypothetical protein PISMIDRAFT_11055 [Pisolithus microcarpus 441]
MSQGTEIWVAAENAYNERVARVENQIIARLRDRLGTARNAKRNVQSILQVQRLVCTVEGVFDPIRGAIQEYQTQLIDSVKEDIKRLHDKFKTQYRFSEAYHMSQMRDLPPIAGAIISGELYAEGQKLQSESAAFRKKLDVRPVYDARLHDINRRDMAVNGRLFEITITLLKEVRNLLWLGFQVPHMITNMAKDAKRVYPHAVFGGDGKDLVAEYRNDAQRMVAKGMNIRWDHFVNHYDTARSYQARMGGTTDISNSSGIEELATCAYTGEAFSELLSKIQAAIDRLNLEGYANLEHWVAELDKRIEPILFITVGAYHPSLVLRIRPKRRAGKGSREEKFVEGSITIKPIVHEIRIQNQVIFLDPPIEYARSTWIKQLHDWLGVICRLRRIQSSRYEIGLQMQRNLASETTYTSLLTHFPDNTLERPFALIELKVQQLKDYVAKWLQFQSLWDLEAEYVFNRLGDSLAHWQQLLTEIKKTRSTFDTSETQRSFGVCIVDYEQVQARVNAKYDAWQRDILSRFGVKLGNAMKEMHAAILKARNELEHHSIEGLVGSARRF